MRLLHNDIINAHSKLMDNCDISDNTILLEELSSQRTPKKRRSKEKKWVDPLKRQTNHTDKS